MYLFSKKHHPKLQQSQFKATTKEDVEKFSNFSQVICRSMHLTDLGDTPQPKTATGRHVPPSHPNGSSTCKHEKGPPRHDSKTRTFTSTEDGAKFNEEICLNATKN